MWASWPDMWASRPWAHNLRPETFAKESSAGAVITCHGDEGVDCGACLRLKPFLHEDGINPAVQTLVRVPVLGTL
jgi:hypothetical protein